MRSAECGVQVGGCSTQSKAAFGERGLLSVIVPMFNEEATIREVLQQVVAAAYKKEIIVVDDGSTDATAGAIADFGFQISDWVKEGGSALYPLPRPLPHPGGGESELLVLRHETNLGKGAAIRTALRAARSEFTIIQDADLEYDPGDYPMLIEPLRRGVADVVYGSRYLEQGTVRLSHRGIPDPVFRRGVSLLNGMVRRLYGVRLTDEATCYKAFRTADLLRMNLQCTGFEFCPEVTAKACRMGLSILEVPISYRPRSRGEGKKIRWMDGVAAVRELWRWRKWTPSLV